MFTIQGLHNKYSYYSRRMVYINNSMIGDTVNIFMEFQWNTDLGETEVIKDSLKIVIE